MKHQPNPAFRQNLLAAAIMVASSATMATTTDTLEEIYVYGEKQQKSLQNVPASIGLLTEETIDNSTIQEFNDVYARIANVVSLRSGNESLFAIRGVSVQGLSDNPNSYTAGVYVDDVALDNLSIRYGTMGVWDVGQIEVYRGPQGTLQGRNALTGAIIVKTQDPTYEWSGSTQAYVGNYGTRRLSVAGGGALIDNELAVRLSVDNYESDGYVKNITRNDDEYAGFERKNYRAKVLWEPSALPGFRALLTVSQTENDTGDNPNARADDPYSFDALSNDDAYHDVNNDNASLNMSWELSDQLTLTSISTYVEDEYDRFDDFDSSNQALGVIDQDGGSRSYSQELRVNFESGNWSGVTGFFFADSNRIAKWDLDTKYAKTNVEGQAFAAMMGPPALGGLGLDAVTANAIWSAIPDLLDIQQLFDSKYEYRNYAWFGEATWRIDEHWAFTLGGRYDREEQDRTQSTDTSVTTVTGNPYADTLLTALSTQLNSASEDTDTDYDAFLPKFVAQYYWSDDINTAFSIQRGYRAGGSSVNLSNGRIFEFDPEFTWNYELSLRARLMEDRVRLNANLFYTNWEDQQVDVSPSGDPQDSYTGNAGKSRLYGAELEVSADVTPSLELFGNLGYVKTEFRSFTLNVGGELADFADNEFPGAPNLTATVGLNYRNDSGIFVGTDLNYQGESYLDNDNSRESDSRALLNVKLGYEQENYSVYVWATNLTDREYITTAFVSDETLSQSGLVQDYRTPGAPRMVGASVKLNF